MFLDSSCKSILKIFHSILNLGSSSLLLETQHPEGLQKIQYLEDSSRHHRETAEDLRVTSAPIFITPLTGPTKLVEGQSSHLECRIEPYPDPTMKVEWFYNGRPLPSGTTYFSNLISRLLKFSRNVHLFGTTK